MIPDRYPVVKDAGQSAFAAALTTLQNASSEQATLMLHQVYKCLRADGARGTAVVRRLGRRDQRLCLRSKSA